MAANRKLTPLLAQRTIESATSEDNLLKLLFTDGSVLHVLTADTAPPSPAHPRIVKKVRQTGDLMQIDFVDNSTLAIRLAEPTSSVLLRDANGTLEYAD